MKAVFTPITAYVYMETLQDPENTDSERDFTGGFIWFCREVEFRGPRSKGRPHVDVRFEKLGWMEVLRQRWCHSGFDCGKQRRS